MGLAVAFEEPIHLAAEFLIPFANAIQVGARLLSQKFHCFREEQLLSVANGFFHAQTNRYAAP